MNVPAAAMGNQLPVLATNEATSTPAANTTGNRGDDSLFSRLMQPGDDPAPAADNTANPPDNKPESGEPPAANEFAITEATIQPLPILPALAGNIPIDSEPVAASDDADIGRSIDSIFAQATLAGNLPVKPGTASQPRLSHLEVGTPAESAANDAPFNQLLNLAATDTGDEVSAQTLSTNHVTALAQGDGGDAAPIQPLTMLEANAVSRPSSPLSGTTMLGGPAPLLPDALAMDADFDDGFGQRIEWMAREGIGQARLRLTPDGMGQISIQLNLDGNRLDAQFQASHSQVRQALNASIDHLRDMLREHGMQLGNTHVGQQTEGRADERQNTAQTTQSIATDNDPATDNATPPPRPLPHWQSSTRNLLDAWA